MTYIEVELHAVGLDGVDEANELRRVSNDTDCMQ